jgi:hypothetical protein
MVHLKSVTLRACTMCPGDWSLFGENETTGWLLCNWSMPGTPRLYIGRPSFTDVHRDLTAAVASGYFTLPGEPDALALQVLRATEPKRNVGRGFAA